MQETFRKDLTHLSWDEVYERQMKRAALVGDWMDALRVKSGDRVLEIGAGPGYVSFALADRVGPAGIVYAVDRSADALAYLERLQKERGVSNIERLVADAATLELTDLHVDSALISMVLHHADDPGGILRNVARVVPPGAPVVIGEFHPEAPCWYGPPREHRLAPETIQGWCEQAGLS
ncbi:MAG: methyltransferase domain-containing protein, partial [Xanthobacteraceae bacterium]